MGETIVMTVTGALVAVPLVVGTIAALLNSGRE